MGGKFCCDEAQYADKLKTLPLSAPEMFKGTRIFKFIQIGVHFIIALWEIMRGAEGNLLTGKECNNTN